MNISSVGECELLQAAGVGLGQGGQLRLCGRATNGKDGTYHGMKSSLARCKAEVWQCA
jgi:hypothetical protein